MNLYISNNFEKYEKGLLRFLIALLMFVLGYNLFHYDQSYGYDGEAHHAYVQNFLNMYLPDRTTELSSTFTYEFFSPPLPYLFPVFVNEICKIYIQPENIFETCRQAYSFGNILFQSFLFLLTIFLYTKIFKLLIKKKYSLNISIFLLTVIFTANYRAVGMLRGEIYVLLFNSLLLLLFIKLLNNNFEYEIKDVLFFGLTIGLLALSKQWGFLLFPSYFFLILFIKSKSEKLKYFKFVSGAFLIGFLISSWFYFSLYLDYGSFTTFNRESIPFRFANQPLSFYLPFGDEVNMVFTKPIRPYFQNQFLPVLYADLWGDYWGYFTFTSRALDVGRNQLFIGDYLARVNIVSIFPTIFLLFGLRIGYRSLIEKIKKPEDYFLIYVFFAVLTSFFGYLWFLISYPVLPTGDTNKATYIIHLFHLLGILGIVYLDKIREKNLRHYIYIVGVLIFVFFHNFSAYMSHFPSLFS